MTVALSIAWKAAIVLLTLQVVAALSVRYFIGSDPAPEFILTNAFAKPFLIIHVVSGAVALLVGPLQFIRLIREQAPAVHRTIGRIYVTACVLGAPSGIMLAIGTSAGPIAGTGFAIAGMLWPIFTFLGVWAVIQRRFHDHREWMIRAYAIAANAITLRLMLPLAGALQIDFFAAYQVIAWLGWITNLVAAEIYLRRSRGPVMTEPRLATA